MSLTVRGHFWATSASSAHSFNRCAQEAGDTVVFIAAGGNRVTSTDPAMFETIDNQVGQEAQGYAAAEYAEEGDEGALFSAYFDGPDPHAVLMVAVAPMPDKEMHYAVASDRAGSVGASYPESTVTLDLAGWRGNRQVVVAFARNATELPTCDLGEPTYSDVVGGSSMAAWIRNPGTRTETKVTVPAGRSGHYVVAVNLKPAPDIVKTYLDSAGEYSIVKVQSGSTGVAWNANRSRRVYTDTVTGTFREPPTDGDIVSMEIDARDGAPNLTTPGPDSGAFTIATDYSSSPTPPYHRLDDVRHHFHPIPVDRRTVPDASTIDGEVRWSPNYLDPSEWPAEALYWEWPDGTDYFTGDTARVAPLVSAVFEAESQGDPEDTSAHPHTHPSIISAFYGQSGGTTWTETTDGAPQVDAWTPSTEVGLAEFTSDAAPVAVDITGLLADSGRAVLFSKAAAKAFPVGTITPIPPDTPGYIVSGSDDGDMTYGYFVPSDTFTLTWSFQSPEFRWVTSETEVDIEDDVPRLRHLNIAPDRRGENWRGTSLRRISSYQ